MNNKKIAFWGTPDFTTDFLDTLVTHDLAPSLIITNPDRPVGRGHILTAPAPAEWARRHNRALLQPERISKNSDFFETLTKSDWDLFVVVAYGKILPESIISLPRFGTINVHYSLLPKYRGATPVESAILAGDTTTGVTIQQMKYKLDSGDILATKEISIAPIDTTPTLRAKLNVQACAVLPQTISDIFSGHSAPQPQTGPISHCSKIKKENGLVSLNEDPIILDRKFRAYQPWPGIYFDTTKGGVPLRVKITNAHLADGAFVIDEVIPENHKRMSYQSFQQMLQP
jgi:methionyl-tRNA formyltransferase